MSRIVPDFEPEEIIIGETLEWRKSLQEYPAGAGWVLTYYFRAQTAGAAGFDQAAVADGADFNITVAATTTATLSAGVYNFQAWVVNGSEKYIVETGQVKAITGFAGTATNVTNDLRSKAKQIIDAIDSYFAGGAAAQYVMNYQIGNRALGRIPDAEKIKLRQHYARIYGREKRAERLRDGASFFQNVNVRFNRPS